MKNIYEIRGEITAIFLCRKDGSVLETLIDTADLPIVMEFKGTWHAAWAKNTQSFYAHGNVKLSKNKWTSITLHKFLMKPGGNQVVDHIFSGHTLDNRRFNLRLATRSENASNRKGATSKSKTGVRGVIWHKASQKYRARVRIKGITVYDGYFHDLKEAEKAVIKARATYMPFSSESRMVI